MSLYFLKGQILDNILSGSIAVANYTGLTGDATSYLKNRPLPLLYLVNGVDLSNTLAATVNNYTSTNAVTVSVNARHFRFYVRDGGGGGSGGK